MKTLRAQILNTARGALTEEKRREIRAQLEAAVDGLPATEQADAKAAIDDFLDTLGGGSIQEISTRTMVRVLRQQVELLKTLTPGVQALAQSTGTPPHIYVLGGVEENITTGIAVLEAAAASLEGMLNCACFAIREPAPPKEGLS